MEAIIGVMNGIAGFLDEFAQFSRDFVQFLSVIAAVVLCCTGRVLRPVYQTPEGCKKRCAGFAFWWKVVEPVPSLDQPPSLVITGLIWNSLGGGQFHIGKHSFEIIAGAPQEYSHLVHKFSTGYRLFKDLTVRKPTVASATGSSHQLELDQPHAPKQEARAETRPSHGTSVATTAPDDVDGLECS